MLIRKLSSINRTLIKLPDLTDGYNWVKLSKEVVSTPDGNTAIYYLPVGEETAITEKEIKRYEACSFNLFDAYKSVYFKIQCMCLPNNTEEWRKVTCICPPFLKNYIGKHIIGISTRGKDCRDWSKKKTSQTIQSKNKLYWYNSMMSHHIPFSQCQWYI